MKQCKLIGLTGGIATGKTTVARMINKDYKIIDADKISKDIVKKGMRGYNVIVEYFGDGILLRDEEIDRDKLGKIIFNSQEKKEKLNEILHPIIFDVIKEEIEKNKDEDYLFLDIPLLFETKSEFDKRGISFSEVWLVYVEREVQIKRLMERDGINHDYAIKKINSQISLEEKVKKSDKIINNDGDREELRGYVRFLLDNLK